MNSNSVAEYILGLLQINYAIELPSDAVLAVDDIKTADYNIGSILPNLSAELKKDLYIKLIMTWLLKTEPLSKFQWGVDVNGNTLPFLLSKPFTNSKETVNYYTTAHLSVTPFIMCYIVKDRDYLATLSVIFSNLREHYDEILLFIEQSDMGLSERSDVLKMFLDSYLELKDIVSTLVL